MSKKILILGSTGMLGHQVYYYFKENTDFEIIDITYRNKLSGTSIILDISNKNKVEEIITKISPDYIINCIGVLIKGSNSNIENAVYINAYLPHQLRDIADKINARLVHISTDCVFSGKKGSYAEKDEKDGIDTYAKTKALGEIEDTRHVTLRTSIVGPELKSCGEGLFHWFMNQNGKILGYDKALWSGVTTLELAKVIHQVIIQNDTGLLHITNEIPINKYDLLNIFKNITNRNINIEMVDGKSVNKSLIITNKTFDYKVPSYEEMIEQMFLFMKNHRDLYKHYDF